MNEPLDIRCQQLVELVTSYLEHALDPLERAGFERHLATCDGCVAYLEQFRTTIRLTGSLPAQELTAEAEDALVTLVRGWQHER